VGGGPGGMMLALLLARRGVDVTLLEAQHDFDRQFRGDTLHPAILDVLNEIGLAERLHALPHIKWQAATIFARDGPFSFVGFRRLATRFPYILFMPQERFLAFLTEEAAKYPHFHLVLGAEVRRLVESNGIVQGVRYRANDGWHEVRAALTVGADGRFSRVRQLADIHPVTLSPPMELLWFRLPRLPGDEQEFGSLEAVQHGEPLVVMKNDKGKPAVFAYVGKGHLLAVFNRIDHWQVGVFYSPGQYPQLRAAGLEAFRRLVHSFEPRLARHVEALTDWHQLVPLSVAFSRCRRWHRPGLLLIGDAAHVMTSAAGAGIKYAIEDAVVAANVLAGPLKSGTVRRQHLALVQRRREWPTRLMQWLGGQAQQNILGRFLRSARDERFRPKIGWLIRLLFRLPLLRDLPGRMVAYGLWRVHVEGRAE
jgi:2-polyprenyl-6-methoxyphenol hydroxylase-like FAD-dependent oxidoreductase